LASRSFQVLGLVVGVLWQSAPASAASFTAADGPSCSIVMRGEIVAGDSETFLRLARERGLLEAPESGEASNSSNEALCLDSDGGSYFEGRTMAGIIHEHGITTRVRADATCFSACAFMFMSGRSLGAEVDGPSRYLDVRGRLGFHAPYFDFADDQTLTGKQAREATVALSKILGEFVEFGSYSSDFDSRPMFSLSLFGEMLEAGPDEMMEVDTVEAAARWGIFLEGIVERVPMNRRGYVNACLNFQSWMLDKASGDANLAYYDTEGVSVVETSEGASPVAWARIDTGGMEERYCLVRIEDGPTSGLTICSRDDFNGLSFGQCEASYGIWTPWYYSMPPDTPILLLAR
jgi:hypothetical protein